MSSDYDDDELDDDESLDQGTWFQLNRQDTNTKIGCLAVWSIGMALAVNISWELNHSILWGTLHGIFSWGYVVYKYLAQL